MKYFLDTEFIEKPDSIQLVSIGIAAEDGRTFYAESMSFDERQADKWLWENVLSKLRWWGRNNIFRVFANTTEDRHTEVFGPISFIKDELLRFFFLRANETPEIWGYYADYDWVVFCWIFGRMVDLPQGFPMYCRDLKQLLDESDKEKIPDPVGEHNALVDALWNQKLYLHLTGGE